MNARRTALNEGGRLLAIIAGTLLYALMAMYIIAQDRPRLFVALFVALPLVFIATRAFEQLVLAVPFVAMLVTQSVPTGSQSRVAAVMLLVLLLAGIWAAMIIVQRRSYLHPSPLNAPLLTFMIICCLALVWSIVFRDPLLVDRAGSSSFLLVQVGALVTMVLSPMAALLVANFVRRPSQFWWVVGLFLAIGAIYTIVRFRTQEGLPIVNTDGVFSLWFVAILYALVIAHPGIKPVWRFALGALLLLHLYVAVIQGIVWLSGWVPSLVAIVAITLFRSRRGFVVLLLVGLLYVALNWDFFHYNVVTLSEEEGDFQRAQYFQRGLDLVREHPIFGTGPAGYALYYMTYFPDKANSSHNGYLDLIAQTGVAGVLCWIWLVLAAIREGYMVLRHAPPGLYRTLGLAAAGGLVGALVAMVLGDWVFPFAYNQGIEGYNHTVYSWVFLGILMRIRREIVPSPTKKDAAYARRVT